MKKELPSIELCNADEATFWPWFRWPDFANWQEKGRTIVIIPLAGIADWGLCKGMDAEESVLMAVIKEAAAVRNPDVRLLVIPPVRFVLGPKANCAFPVEPDLAGNLLEEVAASIQASGFTRILFFNASPWNEELIKAVGRDLRIGRKLQMFCLNLSALGLDFNPIRGGERTALKAVLAALSGDAAGSEKGLTVLSDAARRFASMLGEMRDRPALPNGGDLPTKTWP